MARDQSQRHENRQRPTGLAAIQHGTSSPNHQQVLRHRHVRQHHIINIKFDFPPHVFILTACFRWTPRLAEICTENGLLEAKTTAYPIPKELAIPFCQTQMAVYTEISWVAMDNSSPDAKGPQFRELLERATAEMKKGVWLDNRIEVTVARKAEEGV